MIALFLVALVAPPTVFNLLFEQCGEMQKLLWKGVMNWQPSTIGHKYLDGRADFSNDRFFLHNGTDKVFNVNEPWDDDDIPTLEFEGKSYEWARVAFIPLVNDTKAPALALQISFVTEVFDEYPVRRKYQLLTVLIPILSSDAATNKPNQILESDMHGWAKMYTREKHFYTTSLEWIAPVLGKSFLKMDSDLTQVYEAVKIEKLMYLSSECEFVTTSTIEPFLAPRIFFKPQPHQ